MKLLHKAVTTVFGLGYAPIGPGTFGTLGAFLILYGVVHFFGQPSTLMLILSALIVSIVGIWSTDKMIPEWGEDPSRVVVDEAAGYIVTILFLPLTFQNLLLGFVLFRFFDILKPLGIRSLDTHIKGGLGVMLDDILAGVYACICLHLINHFFPV